jgi:hypothetical protein
MGVAVWLRNEKWVHGPPASAYAGTTHAHEQHILRNSELDLEIRLEMMVVEMAGWLEAYPVTILTENVC